MGRIFILGTIITLSNIMSGQNLVLNPDFEEIIPHQGDLRIYLNTFYAKYWFKPTEGSVDIYRDHSACNDQSVYNVEPGLRYCIDVKSGNYCIGLTFLEFMGQMEHITGTLSQPLSAGQPYKVSFYIKMHPTKTPFVSKGMGYNFSQDSIVFKAEEIGDRGKYEPFYDYLFEDNKVYADYAIDEYILDTTWVKYESIYTAEGGEEFITLGRFAYENDEKLINQFKKLRHAPRKDKIFKFVKSDKSLVCERFFDKDENFDIEGNNYYYIDMVEVVPLDSVSTFYEKELNIFSSDLIRNNSPQEAFNYIDLDSMTSIQSEGEIIIDKGFTGNLEMELGIRLRPMEKYVLLYGEKCEVIIINTGIDMDNYSELKYEFKYPARKLREKPIRFYVEKTNEEEIKKLQLNAKKIELINEPNFKGIFIKRTN